MRAEKIARVDILNLRSYSAGEQEPNTIRLNANEAPASHWFEHDALALNRYPEVRPVSLQKRMAKLFGTAEENLLVTRGSSEAIDVLIRTYCRAYRDSLVTAPPTFEMFRFYADVQGISMINVPLLRDNNFALDTNAVIAACQPHTKLIFVCSPNNPTGSIVSREEILRIVENRRGKSIVVVDEAYVEFADRESMASLVTNYENLVVLRTLSKAQALAGARCGAALAHASTIDVMCRVLPPYSFPTPVVDCVMQALSGEQIESSRQFVAGIISERERLFEQLGNLAIVNWVWPSQANFLLVRFENRGDVEHYLRRRKILVRGFGNQADLKNCARITIGTPEENDALIAALSGYEEFA